MNDMAGTRDLRAIKAEQERRNADQGQFFVARFEHADGYIGPHPVFVVGKNNDSNDTDDVLVCQCTKAQHPVRSGYDIPVKLKMDTLVRTNKIYTLGRDQLEFRIMTPNVTPSEIRDLIGSAARAVSERITPPSSK